MQSGCVTCSLFTDVVGLSYNIEPYGKIIIDNVPICLKKAKKQPYSPVYVN
jgi:hypothetical protein